MRSPRVGVVITCLVLSHVAVLSPPSSGVDDTPDAALAGTILTSDGAAVSGAVVEAISSSGAVARAVASSSGAYRLDVPDGSYTLRVTPPAGELNGLSTLAVEAPRNWPLDFSLSRRTAGRVFITGDVTFSQGAPLTSGTALFAGAGTSITSTGFFSSATLPGTSGTWMVNARGATGPSSSIALAASGGPRSTIQQDTYIDFIVPTTPTRVVVTDEAGMPVADASVRINSSSFGLPSTRVELIPGAEPFTAGWTASGRTDSTGAVNLLRPELAASGRVTLMVDPPSSGLLPHSSTIELGTVHGTLAVTLRPRSVSPQPTAPPASAGTPTPAPTPSPSTTSGSSPAPGPSSTSTPSVAASPAPTAIALSGTVSLSDGRPVPGAVVIPIDPTSRVNGGNSADDAGRYSVSKMAGFAGSWQVSCRAQSALAVPDPLCFALKGGDVIRHEVNARVDFSIPMNLYRIRVVDDQGTPVPNARIQLAVRADDMATTAIVDLLPGQSRFLGSWRGLDVTGPDGWAQVPGIRMTNTPIVDVSISTDSSSRHEGRAVRILSADLSDTVLVVGFKPSRVTALSASSAEAGQSIVITGENLLGASSVRIGGAQAAFTVVSSTRIIATVPSNAGSGVVQVTTASGTTSSPTPLTVIPAALTVVTDALPAGQVGRNYSATLAASGGVGPYRWRLQGTRPSGLALTPEGTLQGTPLRVMREPMSITVTDARGRSATRSVVVDIEPRPLSLPGPINAVSGRGSAQRVSLTWQAPGDDGGNPITGYQIQVSTDQGQTWQNLVDDTRSRTTGRSFAFEPGVPAMFRIAAMNRLGVGPYGPRSVSPVLTAYEPAGAPRDVSVTAQAGVMRVQWMPPLSDGGAPITGYRIRVSTDGRNWTTVITDTRTTVVEASFRQRAGRSYWVQVSAINAGGLSTYATSSTSVYLHP